MNHSYVGHDSFICGTWLIHMLDMTHSYVGHDSFICGTWLIHMWDMTHSYVGHDSFICGTWLIHMCDMTHSYVCLTWLIRCDTHKYSLLHLECHFSNLNNQSIIQFSTSLLTRSLRLYVSFATFSTSLLPRSVEKRPVRLRLDTEIEWNSKYNGLYLMTHVWGGYD